MGVSHRRAHASADALHDTRGAAVTTKSTRNTKTTTRTTKKYEEHEGRPPEILVPASVSLVLRHELRGVVVVVSFVVASQ